MANSGLFLQCLLGMQCKNFAIVASDQTNTQSIIIMKNDENRLHEISDRLIMGVIGDSSDAAQFTQFVSKNIELYKMKNKYQLSTTACVHFTRKNLAESLEKGKPSMVNMLVVGFDDMEGGQLYSMDFLASCVKVPFAGHGFGGLLSMSILERYHNAALTEVEAYEVLKLCVHEIHRRCVISLPSFQVKVVSKQGIKILPNITAATFIL